jgi:DNA-binding CsgD family transcriptional regulator/tetratricopeptide (TPR) repeat protein
VWPASAAITKSSFAEKQPRRIRERLGRSLFVGGRSLLADGRSLFLDVAPRARLFSCISEGQNWLVAGRVSSQMLIGREHELDRVAAALAAARDGKPAFILVAGEAGVGKTRFLREVVARADAMGGQVLEGGCVQVGTEGLPFGPVIEALRGLSHVLPPADLDELLGSGRAELARLMPHLLREGEDMFGGEPPNSSAQGRLFEHLLFLFERLAARAPLLVVFEDVHWADRSTLELLGFLARNLRRGPIVLVVSYRSDELHRRHPLLPFLTEQERSGRAERLELSRFDRSELAAQLAAIVGAQPDAELVERIMARSEGNAFYAEELLASGAPTGRLPDTLREVLLARVATLSEPTQDLVRLAAAGGTRIAPALLAAVRGIDERDLDGALGEAVARHVLVPLDGAAEERYAFRHALVQEAVYGELLPGERSRLHAAFARALADEMPTDGDSSRAAELAYHWQAAHDLPRAFDAWIRAGRAAEAIYAFAEAREDFEHALELWDQVPDSAASASLDRVDLLTRAALHAEGPTPSRSLAYIREAIMLVDPTTEPTRAGLLHERLGQYSWLTLDIATTVAAYQEAVRLVPAEPPSAARSWVLSGLGRFYVETDQTAEAVALCEEALSVARAAGARQVESRALVTLGKSQVLLGDVETGLATMRRARAIASELGNVYEVAGALTWLSSALNDAGRYSEAMAAGLEAEAYASRHGLGSRWAVNALWATAWTLFALGRWGEAAEALVRAQRYEMPVVYELAVEGMLLRLEVLRGQFDEAGRRAPRVLLLAEGIASGYAATSLAELALWQDDPLAARAAVARMDVHPGTPARHLGAVFAVGIRAEADLAAFARARHDDGELAESRARGAAVLARMRAALEDAVARVPTSTPRVAALLAECEAEFSRLEASPDPDGWALAAASWRTLQDPYRRSYALMREAEATLAQQRDRPRAARALIEAHAIATRLGAMPLRSAVEWLAARAGIALEAADGRTGSDGDHPAIRETKGSMSTRIAGRAGPVRRGRYDLTPREREVLALVVDGHSDGEIAEALFISKKTASFHVAMIKGKLGSRSRVEIATDAIGLGLIEAPTLRRM